jgi:pimeloyl-ACP methyl ester carboxylesterase
VTVRTSRVVDASGLRLAADEWGTPDSSPITIVLVHGFPDTAAVWYPVAERLAEHHHVVAYDVRGAGRSAAPAQRSGYRTTALAADLRAVIDACAPGRPVHLAAHDWGSIQSWDAITSGALDGRVASFTTISGPPLDHVGRQMRRRARTRAGISQSVRSLYVPFFHLPVLPARVWRLIARRWADGLHRIDGAVADADWPAATLVDDGIRGMELYRANMVPRLRRPQPAHTHVPVQLVELARDRWVTSVLTDGLEEVAPNLSRTRIDGGHWVLRSDPDAVAAAIGSFAARVGTEAAA